MSVESNVPEVEAVPIDNSPAITEPQELNVPSMLAQEIVGGECLTAEELSDRVSAYVLQHNQEAKKNLAKVACGLWYAKKHKTYVAGGFENWKEYTSHMTNVHNLFGSTRQADRYVLAVERWVIDLGFPIELLTQFSISTLGEIAQANIIGSRQDAEDWLKTMANNKECVRAEIVKNRNLFQQVNARKALNSSTAPAAPEATPPPAPAQTWAGPPEALNQNGSAPQVITPPQVIDEEPYSLNGSDHVSSQVDKIRLEVIDDEDEMGEIHYIRIFHGDSNKATYELQCRDLQFQQMTKEEASMFYQEAERERIFKENEQIMKA